MCSNGTKHIYSHWGHLKKCGGPLGYMKFTSASPLGTDILLTVLTNQLFWYKHATYWQTRRSQWSTFDGDVDSDSLSP